MAGTSEQLDGSWQLAVAPAVAAPSVVFTRLLLSLVPIYVALG